MLNLKDYGGSSDEDGTSESMSTTKLMDNSINVLELNKTYLVNATPDVLPIVSLRYTYNNNE